MTRLDDRTPVGLHVGAQGLQRPDGSHSQGLQLVGSQDAFGQGRMASRLTDPAALWEGRCAQDSPVYGAERRGAPMVAFAPMAEEAMAPAVAGGGAPRGEFEAWAPEAHSSGRGERLSRMTGGREAGANDGPSAGDKQGGCTQQRRRAS